MSKQRLNHALPYVRTFSGVLKIPKSTYNQNINARLAAKSRVGQTRGTVNKKTWQFSLTEHRFSCQIAKNGVILSPSCIHCREGYRRRNIRMFLFLNHVSQNCLQIAVLIFPYLINKECIQSGLSHSTPFLFYFFSVSLCNLL